MATAAKKGHNQPEVRPIIVKKVIADGHGGHHGGAWKVAYADFVTAMMAFFLLLWILGATDEDKRRGIADFFTPTLVEFKQKSAGSNGPLGGDSIIADDNYPHKASQTGERGITIPKSAVGGPQAGDAGRAEDKARFERLKQALLQKMEQKPALRALKKNIRFTDSTEGLRIDLVDEADFSMFRLATDQMLPQARALIGEVAEVIDDVPNPVIVRGHTDSLPYASGQTMNNWMLSTARAEATRAALSQGGVQVDRFVRIEGVADREPFVAADRYDPRNRRMSITLAWRTPAERKTAERAQLK
ncbi:flagellar motor protein MotB [Allosphingosinicella indica]|uniref:Chemotaxis protein MotB n=1 Tax=Allosphingosinicella indica TaxID=941907 RepID=A0A1X7GQD8_9SPHN|nr:flagellar motor protein MotB [Allosphingosinicella indica]SMF72409.1 chemotaxis protein MotB [Allosphingosinicella indica]